jgi:dnd system-associated protein 4
MNEDVGSGSVRDVRVPADKTELLERLTEGNKPFSTMRDVLVFAAAVGWSQNREMSFERAARDRIRWSTMTNRSGTEDLVNMLAISKTDDVDILTPDRFPRRIAIFEAYANGGLEFIEQLIASQPHRDLVYLLEELVRSDSESSETEDESGLPEEVSRLAKGLI